MKVNCAKARLLYVNLVEIKSDRSSRLHVLCKTSDLKMFAIFTRKSLFNKVALKFLIKKRLQHR